MSAEPIAGAPHARIVPEGLLQSCIKVSNEPPSDIRSNMRAAWGAFSPGGAVVLWALMKVTFTAGAAAGRF